MARLVVVSNRVPPLEPRKETAGGLAVAIEEAVKQGTLWFGWSGETTAGEPAPNPAMATRKHLTLATVDLTEQEYQRFYVGFANASLWPLFHYQPTAMEFLREDYDGYRAVNRRFARALSPLLEAGDVVWVHDYQLIPMACELRRLGHANRIGFFQHIPFPPPGVFDALPPGRELIHDFAAYDLIGFQTRDDRNNFLDGARRLAGAIVGPDGEFHLDRRTPHVLAIPVGIDPVRFARLADRSARTETARRLRDSLQGRRLIIGADRLDYSKGLPGRFEAYSRLLERFPQHRLKVSYLQVAPRSREEVAEYQILKRQLDRMAGKINGKFADFDWTPLRYMTRSLSRGVLAGFYRTAAVGLVTPLRDGMNLVAKEYVAAQEALDPGVLVLSRFAGAADTMTDALLVNPHDPDEVAEAIDRALTMPQEERRARWESLYAVVAAQSAASWCRDFLAALTSSTAPLITSPMAPDAPRSSAA